MTLMWTRRLAAVAAALTTCAALGALSARAQLPGQMTPQQMQQIRARQKAAHEKMLKDLGGTAAQRQKLKSIDQKYMPQLQRLQKQYLALVTQAQKETMAVLIPAQQQKLQALRAAQMQQMQRMQQGMGGARR